MINDPVLTSADAPYPKAHMRHKAITLQLNHPWPLTLNDTHYLLIITGRTLLGHGQPSTHRLASSRNYLNLHSLTPSLPDYTNL